MIRLIQILILAFLMGNGLQPLLKEAGWIVQPEQEVGDANSDQDGCDSEDADQSESSDDDLSEKPRRLIKEPKPHDLDFSSPPSSYNSSSFLVTIPICEEGRKLTQADRLPKISSSLMRRTYFSKSVSHSHPIS